MRRGNGAARSLAVVASALFFLLFSCRSSGGKGAPGRAEGRGSLPRKRTSDDTVRGQRERLITSARGSRPGPTYHSLTRNQTARGVNDAEIASSAVGSAVDNKGRDARPREGWQGEFFEREESDGEEGDADDVGLGFDRFDDDYNDWLDEDSEGWSDEEDSEESSRGRGWGRGWRWGSKKSGMQGSAERTTISVRDRLDNARRRASRAYREAKSFMSSEMEGVVLKATRPDNLPVKPKHLESLMRPTAEMPKEFNVYLPVIRKLWAKMTDREWQVAVKALYVVHRFAANGNSDHAVNLKESVAVLRSHHDSRRKVNYFDMDAICDVKAPPWSGEDITAFSEFLRAYAKYVLYRTTKFGPGFDELLDDYAMMVGDGEMLSVVAELVATGLRCGILREEQESAATVAAAILAAKDVRDVIEVCSAQLDYLAREGQARTVYPAEVDRWYAFLRENHESVATLVVKANELAAKHNLTSLRPLSITPLVLELRDEELAEEEQAVPTEDREEQCPIDEMDALETSSPESVVATADLSLGSSGGEQKPTKAVDEQNRGEGQRLSTPILARTAVESSTTSGSPKQMAGKRASTRDEAYRKVSSRPGATPRMASQKPGSGVGDGDGELWRAEDAGARRKAGVPTLNTGGALPRSNATVKAQIRARKGSGGVQVPTEGGSVDKRERDDGGGATRRTKVRRTLEDIQQPKKAAASRVAGVGSSFDRRAPKVRHAVKHHGVDTDSAQLGSAGGRTRTPSSMRKRGARPSLTKSGIVRKAVEGGKAATAEAAQSVTGVSGRGNAGSPSSKLKRSERENPASGHRGKGLHSSAPGKRMKRDLSSAKASHTDYSSSD